MQQNNISAKKYIYINNMQCCRAYASERKLGEYFFPDTFKSDFQRVFGTLIFEGDSTYSAFQRVSKRFKRVSEGFQSVSKEFQSVSKGFPKGFKRVSKGFPKDLKAFPKGFKAFPKGFKAFPKGFQRVS